MGFLNSNLSEVKVGEEGEEYGVFNVFLSEFVNTNIGKVMEGRWVLSKNLS